MTGQRFQIPSSRVNTEQGYVLLTLMLVVCLLVITAATLAPTIGFEIKRDREEELIHRGIEYRRAIRAFAKHTGRFPLTLDELQNTFGARYLRRRYNDPITGSDFRLLHTSDVTAFAAPNSAGGPAGNPNLTPTGQAGASTPDAASGNAAADQSAQAAGANSLASQTPPQSGAGQLGGGVILGVASPSPKKTIREFNHKNHYNQWLFFYSPNYDGSIEVKGPTPQSPVFATPNTSPSPSNSSGSATTPQSPQAPPASQPPQ